jgi:hypothetical protein
VSERVEKLVDKYAMDLSEYHDDNGYALDATKYVAVEGFRAALLEARREALNEAIEICRILESQNEDYRVKRPYLPDSQKVEIIEREVAYSVVRGELERLERLAGEERTK